MFSHGTLMQYITKTLSKTSTLQIYMLIYISVTLSALEVFTECCLASKPSWTNNSNSLIRKSIRSPSPCIFLAIELNESIILLATDLYLWTLPVNIKEVLVCDITSRYTCLQKKQQFRIMWASDYRYCTLSFWMVGLAALHTNPCEHLHHFRVDCRLWNCKTLFNDYFLCVLSTPCI